MCPDVALQTSSAPTLRPDEAHRPGRLGQPDPAEPSRRGQVAMKQSELIGVFHHRRQDHGLNQHAADRPQPAVFARGQAPIAQEGSRLAMGMLGLNGMPHISMLMAGTTKTRIRMVFRTADSTGGATPRDSRTRIRTVREKPMQTTPWPAPQNPWRWCAWLSDTCRP